MIVRKKPYSMYKSVIESMLVKFNDYWEKIKPFAIITHRLDPRFKIDLTDKADKQLFTDKLTDIFNSQNSLPSTQELSSAKSGENDNLSLTEQLIQKKNLFQL